MDYVTPDRVRPEELIGRALISLETGVDMGIVTGIGEDFLRVGNGTIRRAGFGGYKIANNAEAYDGGMK